MQRAESALARLRDATAIQGAKVQSELSARNQRIAELEQRIAAQSDYSEVKRELECACSCAYTLSRELMFIS